ncbi:hypothetical protein FRC10_007353 [Ceratobasidium sp. 414]|nr:hypothetical protein FRC10_007353 [Ceratobasidium sp. 414]
MVTLVVTYPLAATQYCHLRYETHSPEERQSMLRELTDLMLSDKLKAPEHEILSIKEGMSDGEATRSLQDTLGKVAAGRFGKKLLLRFE